MQHQRKLNELPPIEFLGNAEAIQSQFEKRNEPPLIQELGYTMHSGPPDGALPKQISEVRSEDPQDGEIFFKVGRTTGWTAGTYNPCKSAIMNYNPKPNGTKHATGYKDYKWGKRDFCLVWCFIGIKPKTSLADSGDSGSLIFDRRGKATGLYFGNSNKTTLSPPELSCAVSLSVVLKDIETQLGLSDIKLANVTSSAISTEQEGGSEEW